MQIHQTADSPDAPRHASDANRPPIPALQHPGARWKRKLPPRAPVLPETQIPPDSGNPGYVFDAPLAAFDRFWNVLEYIARNILTNLPFSEIFASRSWLPLPTIRIVRSSSTACDRLSINDLGRHCRTRRWPQTRYSLTSAPGIAI